MINTATLIQLHFEYPLHVTYVHLQFIFHFTDAFIHACVCIFKVQEFKLEYILCSNTNLYLSLIIVIIIVIDYVFLSSVLCTKIRESVCCKQSCVLTRIEKH